MTIVTRNILYRRPVDFTAELPPELIYHILSYLPARDLKTARLVNRFLAQIGLDNFFWSELCRDNWSEKLCLRTLPVPSPHVPEPDSDDEIDSDEEDMEPVSLDQYLLSMENFNDHTYDELKPATLWDLANFFPAFKLVDGSWLRAYNLVQRNFSIPYLHATVRADHYAISDTQWEFRFARPLRSSEPHAVIHAFLDYRRDYRLHIVHGVKHWDQPFHWRPLASGSAIRVHEFPPHELSRNSDGYRTMTNQWVCMTSSSEHSFVRDLGALSAGLMRRRMVEDVSMDELDREEGSFEVGERLLKWIDAYGKSPGNQRSCWVGAKKKVCTTMSWRNDDSDDDDDDDDE